MKESLSVPQAPPRADVQAILLAAGKSTRFALGSSKLIFPLCGREMILYPISIFETLGIPITVVTGYQKEQLCAVIAKHHHGAISYVEQKEQRGTGHAVLCTKLDWYAPNILIINGDMPLITAALLEQLIREHTQHGALISFVTAINNEHPHEYGRIVYHGQTVEIIETRDLDNASKNISRINAGIYLINRDFLQDAIEKLTVHNNSQEWYITDLISLAQQAGHKIHSVQADLDTVRGVNTMKELADAEKIIRTRIIENWMKKGVYFEHPESTIIEHNVKLSPGTRIGSSVRLLGATRIGAHCIIGDHSMIKNSLLADQVTVLSHCVITDSEMYDHATVGPFTHLRNVHSLHQKTVIGNFVEVSNSTLGAGTKAKHLSYIGNATIAEDVNIGAGTITCNYDGVSKHITTIEHGAKIGSNNCLIAPVTIGHDAITGAGSVINNDVPPYALAIGRAHQVNKENYAQRIAESRSFIGSIKSSNLHTADQK